MDSNTKAFVISLITTATTATNNLIAKTDTLDAHFARTDAKSAVVHAILNLISESDIDFGDKIDCIMAVNTEYPVE